MNNAERLAILNKSNKTTFSAKSLINLWGVKKESFNVVVKRMVDKGLLFRIARGYYSLKEDFNIYELANTVITPSYISFNCALFYHGISFQANQEIESAALINYKRKIADYTLKYFVLKKELLLNLEGIEFLENFSIATPERAILDCLYLGMHPNVDNLEKVNKLRLQNLSKYYPQLVKNKIQNFLNSF
ncbi:MAG: hypothetical protein PHU82_02385 [Candidatus Pacebacteria bacterium]|jgi:predicted transcriptional regulator of viral defense system|nr:hypothetical protein [Candidatus Paceibacterota bacterium]MDD4994835.1 hypothetical protein [Candidatus Paceibacterota bacterium]MDD5535536.1 hypothetical protein [Candidatus Paceibacterota bacterium]